jgi:hypothetical protein
MRARPIPMPILFAFSQDIRMRIGCKEISQRQAELQIKLIVHVARLFDRDFNEEEFRQACTPQCYVPSYHALLFAKGKASK